MISNISPFNYHSPSVARKAQQKAATSLQCLIAETVQHAVQEGLQAIEQRLLARQATMVAPVLPKVTTRISQPCPEVTGVDVNHALKLLKEYAHAYRNIATRLQLDETDIQGIDTACSNEERLCQVLTAYKRLNGGTIDMDTINLLQQIMQIRKERGLSLEDDSNDSTSSSCTAQAIPVAGRKRSRKDDDGPTIKREHIEPEEDVFITTVDQSNEACSICLRIKSRQAESISITSLECGHSFCKPCIDHHMATTKAKKLKKWVSHSPRKRKRKINEFKFKPVCPDCKKNVIFPVSTEGEKTVSR